MTKIYVIESIKEILKKIKNPFPLYEGGKIFFFKLLNNFFNVNYFLKNYHFFLYHAQMQSENIYFFENFGRGTS